jgi:hypothetical protein
MLLHDINNAQRLGQSSFPVGRNQRNQKFRKSRFPEATDCQRKNQTFFRLDKLNAGALLNLT